MVLSNHFEFAVVLDPNVSWNFFQAANLSKVPDLTPIALILALDGSFAEGPGPFEAGVLLVAVGVGAIVPFHCFVVTSGAMFLKCSKSPLTLELDEVLKVRGALSTFL